MPEYRVEKPILAVNQCKKRQDYPLCLVCFLTYFIIYEILSILYCSRSVFTLFLQKARVPKNNARS